MKHFIILLAIIAFSTYTLKAQQTSKPEDTEYWTPVPHVVTPGSNVGDPPSDAIILFEGKNMDEWVPTKDTASLNKWTLANNVMTVNKNTGDLQTKKKFVDFQLHIEYQIPKDITGTSQARGNSGVYLGAFQLGAGGYELQVLDNYNNPTYVNGQAGSIYKQSAPLVNACRKPGDWQYFDVIWTAPRFNDDGTLNSPARATVFHNGLLVQNNTVLKGDTKYTGLPVYKKHGALPIKLQAHGDNSPSISYRNIWLRKL